MTKELLVILRYRDGAGEMERIKDLQALMAIANAALRVRIHRRPSISLLLSLFKETVIL